VRLGSTNPDLFPHIKGRGASMKRLCLLSAFVFVVVPAAHGQSTVATDVTRAEIEAVYESLGQSIDKQIKVVDIGKDTNVAVGILERSALERQGAVGAIVHHDVTEVYYILEGGGTLVTGGPLENTREFPPDSAAVRELIGPSGGGTFLAGERREVSEGDIVVIPGGVPHGFSRIPDRVKYLSIRIDPDQVLPAGYVSPVLDK
jgi:mannose-6-phosphate isomerase-like protein (cupin superfamily)